MLDQCCANKCSYSAGRHSSHCCTDAAEKSLGFTTEKVDSFGRRLRLAVEVKRKIHQLLQSYNRTPSASRTGGCPLCKRLMLPACLRRLVVAYLLPSSFAVNSLWSTDRTCLAFDRILRLETFCIQARCFAKKRVRLVCATLSERFHRSVD